jgi:hypothetical protein
MFVGTDVIEFINKIINQSDVKDKDKVKQNITKFREYLRLTCMCDETTLTDIDLILSCIDELMVVKSKLGIVDVMSIFEGREETKQPRRLAKTRQSLYDEKHYRHYSSSNNSSCGSNSPSYSSSCGGGSVNRRC